MLLTNTSDDRSMITEQEDKNNQAAIAGLMKFHGMTEEQAKKEIELAIKADKVHKRKLIND